MSYEIKILYLNLETFDLEKKLTIIIDMKIEFGSEGIAYEDHAAAYYYNNQNQQEEFFYQRNRRKNLQSYFCH